jgi:hypothetical protein
MERKPSRTAVSGSAEPPEDVAQMTVSPTDVVYLVARAKEFAVKDAVTEPDPASNPSDDGMAEILDDHPAHSAEEEMARFISNLSVDEQIDLVTLAWLGRDDYAAEEWDDVRQQALEAHNDKTARYLIGMPLLADYLSGGGPVDARLFGGRARKRFAVVTLTAANATIRIGIGT